MRANSFIHNWLCESGLITFVVTISSITNYIQHNITSKFLSEFGRYSRCMNHCFRIISIDMHNWSHNHFCNISAIWTRSRIVRASSKSNLIVYNNVNCSTCSIPPKTREVESFSYYTLPCKGCITVQNNPKN